MRLVLVLAKLVLVLAVLVLVLARKRDWMRHESARNERRASIDLEIGNTMRHASTMVFSRSATSLIVDLSSIRPYCCVNHWKYQQSVAEGSSISGFRQEMRVPPSGVRM